MNVEEFRNYCLSKAMVTEEMPFDDNTLVFKVGGKMFALTGLLNFEYINLKCDPDYSMELREQLEYVRPAFHMNKKHWISVYLNGVTNKQLTQWIDASYDLVVNNLPKKIRVNL